jgi:hypothetical protein
MYSPTLWQPGLRQVSEPVAEKDSMARRNIIVALVLHRHLSISPRTRSEKNV